MATKFLSQVAAHVLQKMGDDLGDALIVLPSQRAAVYLRKHLISLTEKVQFAPDIQTLDTFIAQHSRYKKADRIELLFELYRSYLEVWKDKAEPLESFLKWAPMALKDFNEIDSYLVDRNQIFRDLTNLKEMDEWSLNELNLTANQQQYAWFWKKLGELYFHFTDSLKKTKTAYQGLIFRAAAEDKEQLFKSLQHKRIFFCGFNALSLSEERILKHLVDIDKAEVLWDADTYYLEYDGHEAGNFLRKNFKTFENKPKFLHSSFSDIEKYISIYAAPNEVSQCDIMAKILTENKDLTECAVILANENLLPAVLNALPNTVQQTNVTMGLKVSNGPLHNLFKVLFHLQTSKSAAGDFHYREIQELLNQAYLNLNRTNALAISQIQNKIVQENHIYLSPKQLSVLDTKQIFSKLFDAISIKENSATAQLKMQHSVLKFIIESIEKEDFRIEKEYLFHYLKVLRKISGILERNHEYFSAAAYSRIFMTLAASENLNFVGEPLEGLQIMGMLETRTLDFKNIILLSCNEEVLPGNKQDQSLIPFELKKYYRLPTKSEHDAIFAYHFYRLLQRAENVHLTYNTSGNDWQSTEPSRYIAQIEYDFKSIPVININKIVGAIKQQEVALTNLSIPKSDLVLNQIKSLAQSILSPSAINDFVLCPLNFYYKHILGYRQSQQVEENIELHTLGTVVHTVLEELYQPFVLKGVLKVKDIENCLKISREKIIEEFNKKLPNGGLETGDNRLILEVAVKFIQRFLATEIEELKLLESQNQYVEILALEKKMSRPLTIETTMGTITVNIGGTADRIDRVGNTIRIIDYKTGKVESSKLDVKDVEKLETNPAMAKALQLLTYSWLYEPNKQPNELLQASNISFKDMSQFLRPASWDKQNLLNSDVLRLFEKSLTIIIQRMFDTSEQIIHNSKSTYCTFCEEIVVEEEA